METESIAKQVKNIFIGVAWPYVNGELHVGHLGGYLVPADIIARYHRARGNKVLMASGSDCYGTPITVEADKRGMTPEALVAEYHPKIVALFNRLGLSFDIYTQTITENHKNVVQDFFLSLLKQGYIFKDSSQQYYSDTEKRFLPDRYVEGTCPNCGYVGARSDQCDSCTSPLQEGQLKNPLSKLTKTPVSLKETEHYFLDWPKLEGFLKEYYKERSSSWRNWVAAETKKWLDQGLKPRAITRDLNWGVPIPADRMSKDQLVDNVDRKRIYVWFDAVIGYFSASLEWASKDSSRSWQDFWENNQAKHYYFMGKDNLPFHTLFWPGQLHGVNPKLHLPDVPAINHFLTCNGEKFSKSRGVFVDPNKLVDDYGLEAVRFYVAFLAPETSDADFTYEGLKSVNNSILVAKIGNFINRGLTLGKALDYSQVPAVSAAVIEALEKASKQACEALEAAEIRKYITALVELSDFANGHFSALQPWNLSKPASPLYDMAKFSACMSDAVFMMLGLGVLLSPLLPTTTAGIESMLGVKLEAWPDNLAAYLAEKLKHVKINDPKVLFKKIDDIKK